MSDSAGKSAPTTGAGTHVRAEDIARTGPRRAHFIGRFLNRLWWRTKVIGKENIPKDGPVIIAGNHTGIVDGPVLHGAIPRGSHMIIKQEFFASKLGFLMRWAGQIPIDRKAGRPALAVAITLLKEGRAIGIFPEGSRGSGSATELKAGVAYLAVNGNAPVVPAAIFGTRPPGAPRGFIPRPGTRLTVVFGTPITVPTVADRPGESARRLMVGAMSVISQAMTKHVALASELVSPTKEHHDQSQ